MGAVVGGIGVYYPDEILSNADLEKMVDTSDEWITSRTGIRERRILPKNSNLKASDMGARAALQAMEKAGVEPKDIDAIVVANVVPDKQFPATACFIQAKIGASNAFAFDLTAACAGFVYGYNMASLLIESGQCRNVLVIGTELLSRVVDWTDRNTCILFGDAAGAVVLQSNADSQRGVLLSRLKSDGTQAEILYLENLGGPAGLNTMNMDGKQVFKMAVNEVSNIVKQCLEIKGFTIDQLDLLVLHQANVRILSAIADKLNLGPEKMVINVERFGNTSSASIPIALFEAEQQGRLKPGMLVALAGVGGGMAWGCNLVRW